MIPATFVINPRLRLTIEPHPDGLQCIWDPDVPARLTYSEAIKYRAALALTLADRFGAGGVYVG